MGRPRKVSEDGMAIVEGFTQQEEPNQQEQKTDGKAYLVKDGVTRRFNPKDESRARDEGWR